MTLSEFNSLFTVVSLAIFLAIVVWAFSRHNKKPYEDAARQIVEDDDRPHGQH
ncbi:cytochrome c oxidase cbb3-type subunit 4 [Chitinivorax tropicus]|uniref:Cytochrome c oxidase cbb3-type subunit 4 n=1 Tax=Chitinivorax tropicus TaxID=714531 RepID=A0A840MP21_9PROT|nr:cbb3-type cytochrome c oxidase subunit 3 [Chitinivorax tropicus]MBB5020388.1 cytochrome c oxidase cbb3-type subunit 4 [Chitinivorax tropicus]